jgi:hypothetical protein
VAGVFTAFMLFTASPASAQPSITVTPDTDLVDFQTVTVSGSGFSADFDLGVVMCTAGAPSLDDCDLDTLDFAFTDATGSFTLDYTVERLIETPAAGSVDCATVAGGCIVGVGDINLTEVAFAPVTFDPTVPPVPRLEVELTVDPVGTVTPKLGTGTVSGTVSCSSPADVFIDGFASQRAGRVDVQGFFFAEVSCDGSTTWTADLEPFNGRFVGGRLDVEAFAFAFDGQQFADDEVFTQVRLKGGGR